MSAMHGPALAAYERRVQSLTDLIAREMFDQEARDQRILDRTLREMTHQDVTFEWEVVQLIVANVINQSARAEAEKTAVDFDTIDPADITGGATP